MPSPLAHSAMGYLLHRISQPTHPESTPGRGPENFWRSPHLWLLVGMSLLPDLDAILGFLTGQMARFHNNGTHSLLTGLAVCLAVAAFIARRQGPGFGYWLAVLYGSYSLHIVMDAFTLDGRGVMLFWPLSAQRFMSPVPLFFGVRWSDGLFSLQHLYTLGTELVFVALVVLAVRLMDAVRSRRKPSPAS